MPAIYNYKISISFHKGTCTHAIGSITMPYYQAGGLTKSDQARFYVKKVTLSAIRKTFYGSTDILFKPSLSLHQEIERCILLYYMNCSNFPSINNITIEVYNNTTLMYCYKTDKAITPQFVDENTIRDRRYSFTPNSDFVALNEKGRALRISMSYWLEAVNSNVKQIKFERAWTAFNTLYTFYGKHIRENENHKYIKNQIIANRGSFPQTIHEATPLNEPVLRSYRWNLWLKNQIKRKYFTIIETLMTSIVDSRLKNIFSGMFSSTNINHSFSDAVDPAKNATLRRQYNHITTSLGIPGVVNDLEVALILCVNYAYYLRNQRFHGGTINSKCKICPTQEDSEYEKISNRLIILVKEIYEAENILIENPHP